MLERLSPLERAAFLLHDVFGYIHDEVAAMLDRSPGAVRQVAARARGHLADERPRYERDTERRHAVTRAFVDAAAGEDLDALMDLLAPDVAFVSDGGGVVTASRHPQHGAARVAQVIISLARLAPPEWTYETRELNGEPAITIRLPDGTLDSAWVLHVEDARIARIDVLRNPEKLARLA